MKKNRLLKIKLSDFRVSNCRKFLYFCFMITCCSIITGCASPNKIISEMQRLPEGLPENIVLKYSSEEVWRFISKDIKDTPGIKILTEDPVYRLISWSERVENWRDLGQDETTTEYSVMGNNPNAFKKLALSPGKGIALTTIWIENQTPNSILHIRRVYQGSQSFAGIGHSRGEYEHNLIKKIQDNLVITNN
jgi:hypothetical protein